MSTRDAQRLAAGLDEDERDIEFGGGNIVIHYAGLSDAGGAGGPGGSSRPPYTALSARMRREVAAKRQILALYEEFAAEKDRQLADPLFKAVGPGIWTGYEVLGQVVAALAGVYQDAPAETGT